MISNKILQYKDTWYIRYKQEWQVRYVSNKRECQTRRVGVGMETCRKSKYASVCSRLTENNGMKMNNIKAEVMVIAPERRTIMITLEGEQIE